MSFTKEELDEAVKGSRVMTEFLERLEVLEPGDGDGFTQADLDKVIEALRALVPEPEE